MKVVKIKLYQSMVNYRKEMSYGYVQTYPLPTPSMVRGMAHSLIDAKEYHPLRISIQGCSNSVVTNMQKIYKFDRKGRYPVPVAVNSENYNQSVNRGLMFVDQIVDINLMLHISFDDSSLNAKLVEKINNNTVILGRNEDIARIDECKIVDLQEEKSRHQKLPLNIYLPKKYCDNNNLSGTVYRLPFKYNDVSSFADKRIFQFVNVKYISSGREIAKQKFPIDDEGNPVVLLGFEYD